MQIRYNSVVSVKLFIDLLIILFAFVLGIVLGESLPYNQIRLREVSIIVLAIFSWLYFAKATHLYDDFRARNFAGELIIVVKNIVIHAVVMMIIFYAFKDVRLKRSFILYYIFFLSIFMFPTKFAIRKFLNLLRKRGRNLRNLLIIGAGEVGQRFYTTVKERPHYGYQLIGFLDDKEQSGTNSTYLGDISKLNEILNDKKVDDVIIALPRIASDKIEYVIQTCEQHTVRVKLIPDYFKFISDKYQLTQFGIFPIISIRNEQINELHNRAVKRFFDLTVSSLVIVFILSWLVPLIGIAIKLDSKGKIFYKPERWGRNNKRIRLYKFRSMVSNNDEDAENGKHRQAIMNDPRITRVGRFLRRTNLDEFPQFINVFLGEMSIIGPRPHSTALNLESKELIDKYMMRHLVKPGISGWAQVNGLRGETKKTIQMQTRIDFDIWYIENWSIWLDLQIIFLTIRNMIQGDPKAF
jgi:putative colanic acid biosynthesis UDP-glucose lipid carrier transferase